MFKRSDIPFHRDDTNRYLPWIIAMMVGLSALFLALGTALGNSMLKQASVFEDTYNIQIPGDLEKLDEITKSTLTLIEEMKETDKAEALDDSHLRARMEPWIGRNLSSDLLPLPRIIEVKIRPDAQVNFEALTEKLKTISPDIELDTHQAWVSRFSEFLGKLRHIALALTVTLLMVTALTIVLAVKNGLRIHHKTVAILHSIGAQDDYIARQFQLNLLQMAVKGALIGVTFAALLYAALGMMAQEFSSSLLPDLRLTLIHMLLFLLLILFSGVMAFFASRWTVLGMLKRIN